MYARACDSLLKINVILCDILFSKLKNYGMNEATLLLLELYLDY